MILVTGGLGFIGSHTGRALLDAGERCVIAQRSVDRVPEFLSDDVGQVALETMDCTDLDSVLAVGNRHAVTGIVHLASVGLGHGEPLEELQLGTRALFTMWQAARVWGVGRVIQASTIGVYAGVDADTYREDLALPVASPRALQAYKKSAEILAHALTDGSGPEVVSVRIAAAWGPLGRERSPFFGLPQLVHEAVNGPTGAAPPYEDDGIDAIHVRDCARAIALLQTAGSLSHSTYNIGSGRVTTNREVVDVLADLARKPPRLLKGRNPGLPPADASMDISRLREDTGYSPAFDLDRGVAEYVEWLAAGHPR